MEQPARHLDDALARMSFVVEPGSFALVGLEGPPQPGVLALLTPPAQLIHEVDETSLLLREESLAALLAAHPAAKVERGLRWVRFESPMGWEVVGFLARVTGELAAAEIPIGAICGYSRDHLFVADRYLERTRGCLARMFPESTAR
ncbi:MAG: ACT domain-containing protein [Planctomycetota bacterium]|nr:ACT domain-containing protein [Planctomycetota bacterium]